MTDDVPADNNERRRLMTACQQDPDPAVGYRFWRSAMPDLKAAFWAARQANAGGTP